MLTTYVRMRSAIALVLALGVLNISHAGWGGSVNSSFKLDINVTCESGNYAGEYDANPGVGSESATVKYFYPNPADNLDPAISPGQFLKCTGVSSASGRRSIDFYELALEYIIPVNETVGTPKPGGGRRSGTGIDSQVQFCQATATSPPTWKTTYTAFCESNGANVKGTLKWRAPAPADPPLYDSEPAGPEPFWLKPGDPEFACTDLDCNGKTLDLSGFPMKTQGNGTTIVDLKACATFFPIDNTFTPGDPTFEPRSIAERQVLLVEEEFYSETCTGVKEVLQAYGRHCHNDYNLDDQNNPVPCFLDKTSKVIGQGVVKQAIVDFQLILEQTLQVSPEIINLNECPDNGIVKALILGESDLNVRRIAGLGVDLADPQLAQVGPINPTLAPRLIPYNAAKGQNDPADSLFEEFAVLYSFVPADARNAEFGFFDNDTLEDVRIAYKTCLASGSTDPNHAPGPNGFAQIVKGGFPGGGTSLVDNGTIDLQLLGITIPPGASLTSFEFEVGSSFRTREFDHRVNREN